MVLLNIHIAHIFISYSYGMDFKSIGAYLSPVDALPSAQLLIFDLAPNPVNTVNLIIGAAFIVLVIFAGVILRRPKS